MRGMNLIGLQQDGARNVKFEPRFTQPDSLSALFRRNVSHILDERTDILTGVTQLYAAR
jgi:hypothetical protein